MSVFCSLGFHSWDHSGWIAQIGTFLEKQYCRRCPKTRRIKATLARVKDMAYRPMTHCAKCRRKSEFLGGRCFYCGSTSSQNKARP